ncbi:MAG: shikimate kinase [Actinomycetota bacterium]|nr:shikimate kinase [Actinomycetota bacterium]
MATPDRQIPSIVLTGFMGTGKSTVGQVLAERLGFAWVDTDAWIESRYGPISEIFSANGEEAFRDLERALAVELTDRPGLVISTGGRMMLDPEIASQLGSSNRVFCLVAGPEVVLDRVSRQDGPPRPLLASDRPADRIAELMAEREEAYQRFEQVATDGKTATEVANELEARLRR